MTRMQWTDDMNLGIDVIDTQHRRITDYINRLDEAHVGGFREEVGRVLKDLVDYTQSHFGFEEALMEQYGYPYTKPHRKVHELFIQKVDEYVQRHKQGEDVTEELLDSLERWLTTHIKQEDTDYAKTMRPVMTPAETQKEVRRSWLAGALKAFFRGA